MIKIKDSKRNIWLDFFKLVLCFFVICLHSTNSNAFYYSLFRISVPLFFMISGYFCFKEDRESLLKTSKLFIKRAFKYLFVGTILYIIFDFVLCLKNDKNLSIFFESLFYKDIFHEFFILNKPLSENSFHLWFLISLFVVSIIHFLIVKLKNLKLYYFIIPITVIIYLFFGGYVRLIQDNVVYIRYVRNALFLGMPMFGIGVLVGSLKIKLNSIKKIICLLIAVLLFFLQILESKIVYMELYITSIFSSMFFLIFFVNLKRTSKYDWYYNYFGKSMPFYIYIIHVIAKKILYHFICFNNCFINAALIFLESILIYEVCFLVFKFSKFIICSKHADNMQEVAKSHEQGAQSK